MHIGFAAGARRATTKTANVSKSEWTRETAFSKSNDQQIVYTAFGRLLAVIVGIALLLLAILIGLLDKLLFGGTRIGGMIEEVIGAGLFICLLTVLVGSASSD